MEAVATVETEAVALRREKIRRLDGLGQVCKGRLRRAGACSALAGWLLIPQAAAIAWAIQQVLVEQANPSDAVTALCALLIVGLLRATLAWISRRQADEAVEEVRTGFRRELIRRVLARGPLWLRQRRSGEQAELMGTHADAMEG